MQTLTFTQKLLRQRGFLRALVPLFALFVGIGASSQVMAQATFSAQDVIVNQGNGSVTYLATTFAGTTLTNQSVGATGPDFDINGTIPVLKGGTVTVTGTGTTTSIIAANLVYKVFDGGFTQISSGTISLIPTSPAGNTRTFSLNTANINLLLNSTTLGTYYVSVSYDATYIQSGMPPFGAINDPSTAFASFAVSGTKNVATNISNTTVILDTTQVSVGSPANPNTNENMTYNINPSAPKPFNGAMLGGVQGYEINAGRLFLNGGSATTFQSGGDEVVSVTLFYRVYKAGSIPPVNYRSVSLNPGTLTGGSNTYSLSDAQAALITTDVTNAGVGVFRVQVYTQAEIKRSNGTFYSIRDDNNGSNSYVASFNTKGVPLVSTTWISTNSTNWLLSSNWSNGVPNRSTNAIIPAKDETNPVTSTPTLDDPNIAYEVQNLTIRGILNSNRGLVRVGASTVTGTPVTGATLRIYGDLINTAAGLLAGNSGTNGVADPTKNSTVVFAGNALNTAIINGTVQSTGGNQKIFGVTLISDVRIEGTGSKDVYNSLIPQNTMTFAPGINAIVRTVLPDGTLNTTKSSIVDLKDAGNMFGETTIAFVQGTTQADRPLVANTKQTFGNIGLDITPDRSISLPSTTITRTIGDPFSGPVGSGAMGIKRQYGVTGDVNNNTTSTVDFHYLNSTAPPYDELNGNVESNLVMFKTSNNAVPFQPLGGMVNTFTHTVSVSGVGSINTVTLADRLRPLPVTVSAFDAKRIGSDALITWTTTQEVNNRGFNVQVSTNGKEFRTLTSVPSANPNTTRTTEYRYIDTEANKNGTRYYRLRQVDLDGKETFFAPVAVSFTGKSVETALVAYPNPFNGNDQLRLAFQSANAGKGQVLITDLTGRVIRKQSLDIAAGTTDLAIDQLSDLNNGIYMVRLTLPSGQVQNLKVVKQ